MFKMVGFNGMFIMDFLGICQEIKESFFSWKLVSKGNVTFGNNAHGNILGKGIISQR